MNTVISTRGQLVLPAELHQRDGIVPGQEFDVARLVPGVYRLARAGEPENTPQVRNTPKKEMDPDEIRNPTHCDQYAQCGVPA